MKVPQKETDRLSPIVKDLFLKWRDFLYDGIRFNMPGNSPSIDGGEALLDIIDKRNLSCDR